MATPTENIDAAIANLAQQIKDVTAAGPKVTYRIGDQMVDWNEWQAMLFKQLDALVKTKQTLGGPYIVRAVGRA